MSTAGNPLAASPPLPIPYVGVSVALPSAGTVQNLLLLLRALPGDSYAATDGAASELTLQCDPNSASGIVVMDATQARIANVALPTAPTSYAYFLQLGNAKTYPNGADLSRIYVGSATPGTAAQVNVEATAGGASLRW